MIYITDMQYANIMKNCEVHVLPENELSDDIRDISLKYGCDEISAIKNGSQEICYVLTFSIGCLRIHALKIYDDKLSSIVDDIYTKQCELLTKETLCSLYESKDGIFDIFDGEYRNILELCKNQYSQCNKIRCSKDCCVNIWKREKLSSTLQSEYLSQVNSCAEINMFDIYSVDDFGYFAHLMRLFNTIQFIFQIRMSAKPTCISEGNGYIFFSTAKYIVGVHKYYNYADSDTTFYVYDIDNGVCLICAIGKPDQQALRAGQAYLAYTNRLMGGMNLHASALSYKGKAIILVGERESGKTTNALFGLKYFKDMQLMSNDFVHLFSKGNKQYAMGSCKKMTIRPKTVALFSELYDATESVFNLYDSIGKKGSDNQLLVRKIDDIAAAFKCGTIFTAEASILVEIAYKSEAIGVTIGKLDVEKRQNLLQSHTHKLYNGQEKFWNDVWRPLPDIDYSLYRGIHAVRVEVNEDNIFDTWRVLREMIENAE